MGGINYTVNGHLYFNATIGINPDVMRVMRGDNAMTTLENGNQIRENWLNIIATSKSFANRKQIFLIPMLINSVGRSKEF